MVSSSIMGSCPRFCSVSRKVKFFVLLVGGVALLAWISTLSSASHPVQDEPRLARPPAGMGGGEGHTVIKEAARDAGEPGPGPAGTSALAPSPARLQPCPQQSPLLRGPLALSFQPSLTLGAVRRENGQVAAGQYRPEACVARQSVAILIPHRHREKHLLYLLHHLHPFLQRQQLHYAIYVIHQAGGEMFNRAKLLNVGYLEALKDYDWQCFVFHDVDLVPENDYNLYRCDDQPKHLVVGRNATGYKLRYKGYFGGVTALTKQQFSTVNGFSNTYWGWGGEDDDLRIRVELHKMKIVRPPPKIARYTMIFHTRDSGNEVNKDRMRLLSRTPRMWRLDGLSSCEYKLLSVERAPLYVNITVDIGRPPPHA
ncbi:beta-1,4-galactosyltransferase 4 [Lepisosteus oculatus]|uniref:Beta-1,4-galactosyltransferase n=1 Tax=Lepisosteus oculatus TaxID=7918 RepID=W5M4Q9_LEPOC|nr:PREDICTED: beta-1,4-galactosyltransferase 4 [Lepisosteus oculatus]XP_015197228.1 PREDICTED: beta-1,4-galactosyltransferase 4 [Lepisosteus oculatus]XP_015197229.1 PREDICTED: beta-1,4-galactosyltransferase 4 [Lepisosteus oculatus]XP_015197230.1 PREDICTED: beta-1,4-galactosyltransferase 4 [Lepisosteus oculatus]